MSSGSILQTERLRLRTWAAGDVAKLQWLLGDPQTMAHWPAPLDHAAVLDWLRRSRAGMADCGYARWCCERLSDGRVIGDVGLMSAEIQGESVVDLGYIIHRDFWRQGFALEACRGIVAWARERGIGELVANMAVDNTPSVAVAEKLGMRRHAEFVNPRNRNKLTYIFRLAL